MTCVLGKFYVASSFTIISGALRARFVIITHTVLSLPVCLQRFLNRHSQCPSGYFLCTLAQTCRLIAWICCQVDIGWHEFHFLVKIKRKTAWREVRFLMVICFSQNPSEILITYTQKWRPCLFYVSQFPFCHPICPSLSVLTVRGLDLRCQDRS